MFSSPNLYTTRHFPPYFGHLGGIWAVWRWSIAYLRGRAFQGLSPAIVCLLLGELVWAGLTNCDETFRGDICHCQECICLNPAQLVEIWMVRWLKKWFGVDQNDIGGPTPWPIAQPLVGQFGWNFWRLTGEGMATEDSNFFGVQRGMWEQWLKNRKNWWFLPFLARVPWRCGRLLSPSGLIWLKF